jgi:hypothetical protein
MHAPTGPPELGYYFSPPAQPDEPGHPRLDIYLRDRPTLQHFDPEQVISWIIDNNGFIEKISIYHPWSGLQRYRLCAGRIFMIDRKDTKTEAFTYGGGLEINSHTKYTHCILVSPAPILGIFAENDISTLLVSETEILLAQRRAARLETDINYDDLLAAVEPRALFYASLLDLKDKFHAYPLKDELIFHFIHYIGVELDRLIVLDPALTVIETLSDLI